MSERLKKIFDSPNPKTKLVSYFVGCYPDYKTCLELIKEAIDNGVSIIECGYPTSEASAEGPVIKKAHDKVLENDSLQNLKNSKTLKSSKFAKTSKTFKKRTTWKPFQKPQRASGK